jgi:hypothetical protein
VGIDISGALISKARQTEQDEPPGICYVHDDVTTPGCLGSRDFDGGKDISGAWPTAGSYYDEGHWTAQDSRSALRRQVGASHRMLSTYFTTLRRHGLWLDQPAAGTSLRDHGR